MPYYPGLNYNENIRDQKVFIKDKLLLLKEKMAETIPGKTVDESLLLASWNIREFDSEKYGPRMESAYYYMAEIISHFDFVAIQEVRDDLKALKKLISILGYNWDYIVSDITEGRAGNGERMAFVFDRRKVTFMKMAGELVIPPLKDGPADQFARTPYIVSFQSGWFKFHICTVHMYFGSGTTGIERRTEEIHDVAMFLKKRADRESKNGVRKWDNYSYILLGDFNIIDREDNTFKALTEGTNFFIHEGVMKKNLEGSNVKRDKYYDQIAFLKKEDLLEMGTEAGIFDFFNIVFTQDEFEHYKPFIETDNTVDEKFYKEWRTYQMSDHLPLWVEMKIDFSKKYLADVK